MSDLKDIILAIQDTVGAVTGIRVAPDYAPAKLPPGVSSIALPSSGTFDEDPSQVKKGLHDIRLFIMCPWGESNKVLEFMIPFGDDVAYALLNDRTLGSTVSTFGKLSYVFGGINWATPPGMPADAIGFTFTISEIKQTEALS